MPTVDNYLINIQLRIQNDKALKAMTDQLQRTGQVVPKAQENLQQAGKGFKAVGRGAQNAAFQVTDFIVQIESGQSVTRAFAQQAPQLLAGFGAFGAIIGVAAAALPALIRALSDTTDELETTDEVAEASARAIDRLNDAFGRLDSSISALDLSSFVEQFQNAGKVQENLLLQTLEFQRRIAELRLGEVLQEINLPFDVGFESGQAAREIFIQQMGEFAESVGLAAEEMIVLDSTFRQALDPTNVTADNLAQLVIELEKVFIAGGGANNQLEEFIGRLRQAEKAARDLENIAGPLLQDVTTQGTQVRRQRQGARAERQADQPLDQEAKDFIESIEYGQQLAQDFSNTVVTEFDLASEAASIFGDTMDTAFNGVAMGTQSVSDAFENMAKTIIAQLLKIAAQVAITKLFGPSFLGGAFNPAAATGAVINRGNVVPMARGGVVNGPTIFPMQKGLGLMGERGAEAVLPLTRTGSGNLGVESSPVNVVINNMAPGVTATPRQGGDGLTIDVVMDSISGAIRRGGNDVANALEESYSIGRGRAVY